MKKIKTWLISDSGSEIPAEFYIWDTDPQDHEKVKVSLVFAQSEVEKSDVDYFSALQSIRKELKKNGLKIKCYGGSRNVYPSGMSLNMGAGEKAYRLSLGKHPTMNDIVSIFESGTDVIPATVEEQNAFFEQWTKSITGLLF